MPQQNTTVSPVDPVNGRSKWITVDHTGPTSYVTGGEVFPQQSVYGGPNSLGLSSTYFVSEGTTEDGLYDVVPVFGAKGKVAGTIKLKWLNYTTGAEPAPGTNLSASVVRILVIGG